MKKKEVATLLFRLTSYSANAVFVRFTNGYFDLINTHEISFDGSYFLDRDNI
jgi:hypothetical protein